MLQLFKAIEEEHYDQARMLFNLYAASLEFNLDFQGFQEEIESLPGEYASPAGCILLAQDGDQYIGCVALRKLDGDICEMKRLYVRAEARGLGAGRALVRALIKESRKCGYQRMRLDTVPSMQTARALYVAEGFKSIDAYRYNPIEGTAYMELILDTHSD